MMKDVKSYSAQEAFDEIFRSLPKKGEITNLRFDICGWLRWTEGEEDKFLKPDEILDLLNRKGSEFQVIMIHHISCDDEFGILVWDEFVTFDD